MKQLIIIILTCFINQQILFAQPKSNWKGTSEEKISGLMTIWAQVKFGFPHTERLEKINWDSVAYSFIPKVLETKTIESYYKVLMKLTTLLQDSHTEIIPPWGRFIPDYDIPPIELIVINNKYYINRTGENDEIKAQKILPGFEILEIDDGIPVNQYFEENVLKYHSRGTTQADHAALLFYSLHGPKGTKVKLKVRNLNGEVQNVELSRTATTGESEPFFYTFIKHLIANTIESNFPADSILYVNIPNFEMSNKNIREDFIKLIDSMNVEGTKGIIIDLRYNMGGSHSIMHPIVSSLINSPIKMPTNHYFHYTAANIPWGIQAITWKNRQLEVLPREGKRFCGPLVLLIGPYTHSSGEDMVIELSQRDRCMTIGEPTSGGAGGKLSFNLAGGGEFNMSTFKATYPGGREYMKEGIKPDIEIKKTVDDIIEENDLVLKKAIELIKSENL